ncbi:regulatory protein RecX [Chloroflexota bacterium]
MALISALRFGKGHSKKASVSLDNASVFSLEAEVALKEGLKVGQELPTARIEALKKASSRQRCYNAAIRFLGYRPRSEQEVRQRLKLNGFKEFIDAVISDLAGQGLVDDAEFARFWAESRRSFSPRSRYLIALELKQKGVPVGIIEPALNIIDDNGSAYRAAQSKSRSLKTADYQDFRRRLGDFLKRRGFAYGIIIKTIERLWQERQAEQQEG